MTIPWRVLLVSLTVQLSKAAANGVLTASCHSDVIELNVPYDKPVELSELHYRGCNRANAEFTQNETTYHVNVKLDIQNCTSLWRSAFQINHSGTLILGRYYAAIDKWINFDLWEFNTHCEFPKFYDLVFDYGTVAIERNDTETDPGSMELVFAASAYQTASYEDKVVHDLLRAGTMINIGLELVNEGLPGCEISFAPVSCQIHATVDDQAFNFTLYDYERDNCKNDVIDFSLNWDEGKEIWKLRHMLFLFGDVERTDMELHCRIAVCKNQDFVDNTCNHVASACMDNGNGDHFGNPCNQTYVTCPDGSTRANEPCPDVNHCDPNPCVNADKCNNRADTYDCGTCHQGYEGKNCDIVNHCDPNPCVNADQCTKQADTYDCGTCHQGYEGKNCDIVNHCDPDPCVNADQCTKQTDNYDCGTCHQGYEGKDCDIVNHCDPDPCVNANQCTKQTDTYECFATGSGSTSNGYGGSCHEGYTGKNCSIDSWVTRTFKGVELVGIRNKDWNFETMAALPGPPATCNSYVPWKYFASDDLLSILKLFHDQNSIYLVEEDSNTLVYGSPCAEQDVIIAVETVSDKDGAWNPNAFDSEPPRTDTKDECSYTHVRNTPLAIYACLDVDHCDPNPCVNADHCKNRPDTSGSPYYVCTTTDGVDNGYSGSCRWGYEGRNCDIDSFGDGWVAASYNGIKLVGKISGEWDFHFKREALPDPPAKCSSYVPSGAFRGDELLSILNLFSSHTLNKFDYGSPCADHRAIIAIDTPSSFDGGWNPNAFSSKPAMGSEWGECSYHAVSNTPLVIYACQ